MTRGIQKLMDELQTRRSVVVFSPHQDDETLGCGGTIIQLRRHEIDVKIVFMTDGSQSHAQLMPPDELVPLRYQEAKAACEVLGVSPDAVTFLGMADGGMTRNLETATEKAEAVLREIQPGAVCVPYSNDVTPDHVATNHAVWSALNNIGQPMPVFEYPVWFWHHWPRTYERMRPKRTTLNYLTNTLRTGFGLTSPFLFRVRVDIRDVLDQKRQALEQHRSQVTRLQPDPSWGILSDVSNGRFLDCFFGDYEVFRRRKYGGPHDR